MCYMPMSCWHVLYKRVLTVTRCSFLLQEAEYQKGEVTRLRTRVQEYEKEVFALERQIEELQGVSNLLFIL